MTDWSFRAARSSSGELVCVGEIMIVASSAGGGDVGPELAQAMALPTRALMASVPAVLAEWPSLDMTNSAIDDAD